MARRLIALFMAFAMLLGGSGLPTLAHAHGGAAVHALELLDGHHDAPQPAGSTPGEADQPEHHHCGSTLGGRSAVLPDTFAPTAASPFTRPVTSLTSLGRAPPTEPPAA